MRTGLNAGEVFYAGVVLTVGVSYLTPLPCWQDVVWMGVTLAIGTLINERQRRVW